uniref:Uncharacterized protein n=1 Tax=viral metagenome TaxID=1070528 RepID=A0A6H1ZHG9_9ZZZZ
MTELVHVSVRIDADYARRLRIMAAERDRIKSAQEGVNEALRDWFFKLQQERDLSRD